MSKNLDELRKELYAAQAAYREKVKEVVKAIFEDRFSNIEKESNTPNERLNRLISGEDVPYSELKNEQGMVSLKFGVKKFGHNPIEEAKRRVSEELCILSQRETSQEASPISQDEELKKIQKEIRETATKITDTLTRCTQLLKDLNARRKKI